MRLEISGFSAETSESLGANVEPLNAFGPNETREVATGGQFDAGTWQMSVTIYDAGGDALAKSDPQSVTVPGPEHHREQFADSSKLQFTIEPTHVHKDAAITAKVDYRLSCTGTVDILPGFPILIHLSDSDGNEADQLYNLEHGVRRGASEPKFLHVGCGYGKAGETAKLTMTGDLGGAAEKDFKFTLTWKDDGTADVAPA
jgi:hypothetical protein